MNYSDYFGAYWDGVNGHTWTCAVLQDKLNFLFYTMLTAATLFSNVSSRLFWGLNKERKIFHGKLKSYVIFSRFSKMAKLLQVLNE